MRKSPAAKPAPSPPAVTGRERAVLDAAAALHAERGHISDRALEARVGMAAQTVKAVRRGLAARGLWPDYPFPPGAAKNQGIRREPAVDPTPEEIRERCAAERERWPEWWRARQEGRPYGEGDGTVVVQILPRVRWATADRWGFP